MTITFRLTKTLYDTIRTDLERPHQVAAERIGFIFVRPGNAEPDIKLILASDYQPVADQHYLRDHRVGARIGGHAIRAVMQRLLDEPVGAFHLHMHPFVGTPSFSGTDLNSLPPLIQSFRNISGDFPHGAIVLSPDSATGICWMPGESDPRWIDQISVVGHPMFIWRKSHGSESSVPAKLSRQSV